MNPNKALWEKGDFTQIASMMRVAGSTLVESLQIAPPLRMLDLGCGDGTTALPLAHAGVDVVGVDIATNLVEAGAAGIPPDRIVTEKDTFHFTSPDRSPADLIDAFRHYYGPTMNAFEAAEKNEQQDELHRQMLELAHAQNLASDGGVSISATYLRVTVQR